jgi:acyl carrier protein
VADQQSRAREILAGFLERAGKAPGELTPETRLYGDGLELDSLEAAELSALLEDGLGTDPFSAGDELPETIGDIMAFYAVPSGV